MANDENLTPFKKGQSGNPSGMKVGTKHRSTIIKEVLALAAKTGGNDEHTIAKALIDKAAEGDVSAIKEFHDTMHGKITDTSFNLNADTKEEDLPAEEMKSVAKNIAKSLQEQY